MRNQRCYSNERADQNKREGSEDFLFIYYMKNCDYGANFLHLLHQYLKV